MDTSSLKKLINDTRYRIVKDIFHKIVIVRLKTITQNKKKLKIA